MKGFNWETIFTETHDGDSYIITSTTTNKEAEDFYVQKEVFHCDDGRNVQGVNRYWLNFYESISYDFMGRIKQKIEYPIMPLPIDTLRYEYHENFINVNVTQGYKVEDGVLQGRQGNKIEYTLSKTHTDHTYLNYPYRLGSRVPFLIDKITTTKPNGDVIEEYFKYTKNQQGLIIIKEHVSPLTPYKIQYFYETY